MVGEFAVRAAVMRQAIADLLNEETSIRNHARAWIAGELVSLPGYSFEEIADLFAIDRDAARSALLVQRGSDHLPRQLW